LHVSGHEAAPAEIMPFPATEATLDNGLRVIIVPTGFPHLVSLQIPVQTGSRNEVEPGKSGFAHFFEHMMFRGTPRFPAAAYQDILTRSGARQNAYTTDDFTNYHTTFAAEDLETILEIEADRFMHLEYSEPDFRTEARAILGEYNKSASDPLTKLFEAQRDTAFRVHTYKHTTMGFLRDIEAMPGQYEYSRLFFERWYRPEYTTVLLAGDLEPDAALALVEKHFGPWRPAGKPAPVSIPAEPKPAGPVAVHVTWPSPTLPWLSIGFRGPGFSTRPDGHAPLDVLLDLTFGETSDVYQDLVERRQLVDQFFAWAPTHIDPGLFSILARVKRPEDAPAVQEAIAAAIAGVRHQPVDRRRLEEAKSNMRYSFARTLDNSESIAGTLARFVRIERRYGTINELFRAYQSLTPEHLHEAARKYLSDSRMVLATLSHDPLPAGATSPLPVSRRNGAGRRQPLYAEVSVPSSSHLVRFKILFRAGSAYDPPGKEGLGALAAEMIAAAGSTTMRIDEVNRALFPIAGSFRAQVDRDVTVFTGVVHRDNVDRFYDIVLPQLTQPGFREEDFLRLKEQHRNALVQDLRSNNDEELGKEVLEAVIHEGGSYQHPPIGTVSGLEAITLDDVKQAAARLFCRANMVLGYTGAFPDGALDRLRSELGALPAGAPPAAKPPSRRHPKHVEVHIVEKETRSVAISFGHPIDVTRADEDFPALWLATAWLGEHRASHGRLFQRLREVRGLNYGNYAYIEAFPRGMYQFYPDPNLARRSQLFEVWIRPVEPHQAVFALKAGIWEVRRLIDRGLDEAEFELIREYLTRSLYVITKTQDQQLGYALDSHWFGMGDFVATMRAALTSLTCGAVNEAVRRHLSGHDLAAVMVTKDAAALRAELLSREPTPMTYDSPRPPDVLEEDQEIGALDLGLVPERVTVHPASVLFS
jgi:zinc protease